MFRKEVILSQQTAGLGTIHIEQSGRLRATCAAMIFLGIVLLGTAAAIPYGRHTSAPGYLKPIDGLPDVVSQSSGVVREILVREGESVKEGQSLFVIDTLRPTLDGSTYSDVAQNLAARQLRADGQENLIRRRAELRIVELRQQQQDSRSSLEISNQQLQIAQQRVRMAGQVLDRYERLLEKGFVSDLQLQEKREALSDLQLREKDVKRAILDLQAAVGKSDLEISNAIAQMHMDLMQLDEERLKLKAEIKQNEATKSAVVVASSDGVMSSINLQVGDPVQVGQGMATLIKAENRNRAARPARNASCRQSVAGGDIVSECPQPVSPLQVVAYVESRQVPYAHPGDTVWLSFDAYLPQRFGKQKGTIKVVSMTPIEPANLPPGRRQRLFAVFGEQPLYRVDIELERQSLLAGGNDLALKPGMNVDVDIVREKKTMVERILEPFRMLRQHLKEETDVKAVRR